MPTIHLVNIAYECVTTVVDKWNLEWTWVQFITITMLTVHMGCVDELHVNTEYFIFQRFEQETVVDTKNENTEKIPQSYWY